jgi:hypothetical protein
VVYLVLAPKGREDPATLSGSAAELLEPDSIEDDGDEAASEVAESEPEDTTTPVVDAEEDAEPAAVDEPAAEAEAEAVVAEADAAEVDPPEVEVEPAEDAADASDDHSDDDSDVESGAEKKPVED